MSQDVYILLIGSVNEPIIAELVTKLVKRPVTLVVVDFQQTNGQTPLTVCVREEGVAPFLKVGKRTIPLEAIRSTYIRIFFKGMEDEEVGTFPEQVSHRQSLFPALVGQLPGLVVNPYEAASGNASKLYQLGKIAQLGFHVPRTLVTSIPEEALAFYDICQGRVIYKSISSVRSIVQRMTQEDFSRVEQIRHCPVQFQEYIPGIDLRVHVVGKRIFASQIETSSTDYRYTQAESFRSIRPVELSLDLQERCLALVEGLGLFLAGVDLRRTLDGDYYCFEVNTSPAFTFYEQQTGQRIGDALVDMLCRGTL